MPRFSEEETRHFYIKQPVPQMPLRHRRCRLGCHRREDTHPDHMYEVRPGQLMCIYDMALVAELFREIVPDGEEAYRQVRQ